MMRQITAMLLAAGLGTRLRPLTDKCPKPLIEVSGRAMIDRLLDALVEAGIGRVIVNVHYHADQIETHMRRRKDIEIIISDERQKLLDTGGAVVAARELFADNLAIIMNTDAFWDDGSLNAFTQLVSRFDPEQMDYMLLVADKTRTSGYRGQGDFFRDTQGRLARRGEADSAPFVHAGTYILHPRILNGLSAEPFSANRLWDKALARKRLFSHVLDAFWMHVGDPLAVREAEDYLHKASP